MKNAFERFSDAYFIDISIKTPNFKRNVSSAGKKKNTQSFPHLFPVQMHQFLRKSFVTNSLYVKVTFHGKKPLSSIFGS